MEDFAAIDRVIGDASLVALGEAEHLGAEPLQFRNRLLRHLIEHRGFTAIALESGLTESRVVHDYVRGAPGELADVVARGLTWTFDELPQNHELVRWLRDYNAHAGQKRKINFYGFDVPGSPGNPYARRGADTAIREVLHYLARVDPEAGAAFQLRLDRFLSQLRFGLWRAPEGPGYHTLTSMDRDELTATVADLVAHIEMREARYIAASSPEDYRWAARAALGARQLDGWLRQVPLGWQAEPRQMRFLDTASDLRDRAQADNLGWIIEQEGSAGKLLVHAHNGHISKIPVRWKWRLSGRQSQAEPQGDYLHQVAGVYLRRWFGDRFISIGNLIGGGEIGCGADRRALPAAAEESADGLIGSMSLSQCLLDWRDLPAALLNRLRAERAMGPGIHLPPHHEISMQAPVVQAFDAVLYFNTVSPARR